ncbi:hypothetical protein [Paractinoplanes rishiriensis]|uniref:Uncharacterized protein n=1 Tax=Paractinoplanes rishiriensis TaxID=1050105 RepID=A0A919K354_9ACTN|nr:hypothetical protein [Actinoplanes rishiriensis]GIE95771.1 hypothetical protein Ari01nite_32360 [Actinoplanes rishiriensis]
MNQLSTLPTTGEQTRRALLLLGAPAAARFVVDVHGALFDGDLSTAALARLLRERTPGFCAALRPDLTAAPGLMALADWSLDRRIMTPAVRRADELAMIVRVAEFVAMRRGAGRAAGRLLRELAPRVPGGVEALDLAEAARDALADAALTAQIAAEGPVREAAAARAAELDQKQQLYGVPAVPHQRGGG